MTKMAMGGVHLWAKGMSENSHNNLPNVQYTQTTKPKTTHHRP